MVWWFILKNLHFWIVNWNLWRFCVNYLLFHIDNKNNIKNFYRGVGAGIILTPVLLEYKILPEVVAYTCSFISLISATVNFFLYLYSSTIIWDYTIICTIFGVLGFVVGLEYIVD